MSLSKQTIVDRVEILSNEVIQVRRKVQVTEDGVELSFTYFREVLAPGDNVSQQPQKIRAIAHLLWTPAVIAAYKASLPHPLP
jgi:hypothetical protein